MPVAYPATWPRLVSSTRFTTPALTLTTALAASKSTWLSDSLAAIVGPVARNPTHYVHLERILVATDAAVSSTTLPF